MTLKELDASLRDSAKIGSKLTSVWSDTIRINLPRSARCDSVLVFSLLSLSLVSTRHGWTGLWFCTCETVMCVWYLKVTAEQNHGCLVGLCVDKLGHAAQLLELTLLILRGSSFLFDKVHHRLHQTTRLPDYCCRREACVALISCHLRSAWLV